MSDSSERANIAKQHLHRASKSLESSEFLHQQGLYEDAISRAYYAAYHAAYALLYYLGYTPKTHKGLQNMFFTHVVQAGLFDREMSKILGKLAEERNTADYGALPIIDQEESEEAISMAKEFVRQVQEYFEAKS